eukprot:tig00020780_g13808.t1
MPKPDVPLVRSNTDVAPIPRSPAPTDEPPPATTRSMRPPRTAQRGTRRPSTSFLAGNWTKQPAVASSREPSPEPAVVSNVEEVLYMGPQRSVDDYDDEVLDFALHLGIDPDREPYLLPVAEEAYDAPLPAPWRQIDDGHGRIYFYNDQTDVSQWEHPRDKHYRAFVFKLKAEAAIKKRPPTGPKAPTKPASLQPPRAPPLPPVKAVATGGGAGMGAGRGEGASPKSPARAEVWSRDELSETVSTRGMTQEELREMLQQLTSMSQSTKNLGELLDSIRPPSQRPPGPGPHSESSP